MKFTMSDAMKIAGYGALPGGSTLIGRAEAEERAVESGVCPACDGTGSPQMRKRAGVCVGSLTCTRCGGTGRVEQSTPSPNAGDEVPGSASGGNE